MKKLMLVCFPGLLILCSAGPSAQVENLNFEVLMDGLPIGTYTVNRTETNGTLNFRVENSTASGLIRRSEHRSIMLSSYRQSKMMSSDIRTWVNQKLESSSLIKWDGDQYIKQDGDELTLICNEMVTYSSVCVYFEEPIGRTSLFHEKYGKELTVVNLGDHKYEVGLPNGSVERYSYRNGKVEAVEIVQSFATILLKAVS